MRNVMNAAYRLPAAAFMHVMCHRLVIKMIKLPLYHTISVLEITARSCVERRNECVITHRVFHCTEIDIQTKWDNRDMEKCRSGQHFYYSLHLLTGRWHLHLLIWHRLWSKLRQEKQNAVWDHTQVIHVSARVIVMDCRRGLVAQSWTNFQAVW